MYDKNCKECNFIVYVAPLVAIVLVALAIAKWFNSPEHWISLAVAAPFGYVFSVWSGKRSPMLHERIK